MSRFNVRVYGIWVNENKEVLVSEESIGGQQIIKFPGGGLELGEGLKDALVREWQEEMNASIEVLEHFYTTDFYQPSAYDDSQVISIYYSVRPLHDIVLPYITKRERAYFAPIDAQLASRISLPIDKVVASMLANAYNKK
jgi:8-oxo-dGTP diphosphatase